MDATTPIAPDLRTARLDLVALDPARDTEALHRMYSRPEMAEFGSEHSGSPEETRAFLERRLAENGGWTWVVRLRPSTEAIGTVGIFADQGIPVRGVAWDLNPEYWDRGLMSEAARAVVDHLLGPAGVPGVEAWIDVDNVRSLGVARKAGLMEGGRLPRTYADRVTHSVVMVRAAEPAPREVMEVAAVVPVSDIPGTISLLQSVFGLHVAYVIGEPPRHARLRLQEWSGSPGLVIEFAEQPVAAAISVAVGIPADEVVDRARSHGLTVLQEAEDKPWYRRVAVIALPDGHRVEIVGPASP
ncbi:MAG TPA: GNAT family N-acetyltransferase [Mycobacteriales bacterium]|nr:GNAT family N-acetyltransferase [Mycobacteriales bacterium]